MCYPQSEEDELALFMVWLHQSYVPTPEEELLKSTEVIDDGITALWEERLQRLQLRNKEKAHVAQSW